MEQGGKFPHLKLDSAKLQDISHDISKTLSKMDARIKPDGVGGVNPLSLLSEEKGRLESPRPSTSNCQTSHWPDEGVYDDERQNVVQQPVIQKERNGREENVIIISDEDHDDVPEIPKAPKGFETENGKPKSPLKKASKIQKPQIPIIEAQPLRRKVKCYYVTAKHDKAEAAHFKAQVDTPSTSCVNTAATVPTKTVQDQSIGEFSGWSKRKRRASDQSEDSLEHLKQLRLHGQEGQKVKRFRRTSTHKKKGKNLKKLQLDPQEMQFHNLKRDQLQKATATPLSPTPTKHTKKAKHDISEGEKHESDEKKGKNTVSIPGEQPVQPLSSHQSPTLQRSTSLHEKDDESLKADMSSMSRTTTKIFSDSSRSDTLVKDMTKLTAPKPKIAHQGHMPLPRVPPLKRRPSAQPEFRHLPIAKVPPCPPQPQPKQVCKTRLQSPPKDKRYPCTEVLKSSGKQKASILKENILKWKYSFFKEYKELGPPETLCDLPLRLVPRTFPSFKDYYDTFFPLLLTNTFEELVGEWLREGRVTLKLIFQSVDYGPLDSGLCTINKATFIANLTPQQKSEQFYPKVDDVVILWLPQNTASYARSPFSDEHKPDDCEPQPHFGIVSHSEVTDLRQELKVQTFGNVLSVDKQQVQCEVIGSMLSAMRELNALCHIQDKALIQTILAPDKHFAHVLPDSEPMFEGCNKDQAKAINCVLSMVMSAQPTPKICMIHGPPGTGKSDTIVNLLYQLSQKLGAADGTGQKPWRTLVCAPSTAAVDSLMEKIIAFFQNLKSAKSTGSCGDINLVRLGTEKNISKQVEKFSLEYQADRQIEKAKQKIATLEQNIHNLTEMHANCQTQEERNKVLGKKAKVVETRKRLWDRMKLSKSGKYNMQRVILQEANVICCTLSTSGGVDLRAAFPSHLQDHTPFNCVIIDEAGQAKETETLIPLLFRCPSLVLVGDPHQLPPTVISQKTKELGFDQSLMDRIYKSVHGLSPPHTHFLSQQYRMHVDIQNFPSKYFYRNLLKADGPMAQSRCCSDWACESYRVFDVADGQETSEKDSFFNTTELDLTVELVRLVTKRYQDRNPNKLFSGVVGVITPCKAQRFRIHQALQREGLSKGVMVNTVNGFQGREKDCIIVSCVRSSNNVDSIEFLGSRQQINVAITRAKYSLFILGHLNTLKEHRYWKPVIQDAEDRGFIIKSEEQYLKMDARKILKEDDFCLSPPHRTQDWSWHPSNRPHLSRSNSTTSYSSCSTASPREVPYTAGHQGSSWHAAASKAQPLRASRDRRDSCEWDRQRP
ncbi:probable helicase senataxin [Sardina pilchardus]|uniref:probable helicase senataxin n=1 Tax=Sardina pilchardus TaxID=27697 RepID=UPI002E15EE84